MNPPTRVIAHVDMDAFYAAIEQRDNPQYRGLPVVVGAAPNGRGVVAAASYEARRFGIRSAMPSREASARCPHAIFIPGDMEKYRSVSKQLFDLLDTFTPQVEALSIDEAFLDLTGCPVPRGIPSAASREGAVGQSGTAFDTGLAIAHEIRARIRDVLHLPVSIGVAPNKFLAKVATELAKPDGLRCIKPEEVEAVLDPLPVSILWGVGDETRERLRTQGITTVGALRRTPTSVLRASLGFAAEHLARLSRGIDDRRVEPIGLAKSVGRETTFAEDTADRETLLRVLLGLAEDVARRLRADGLTGQTVTLKVRYEDFQTITRSSTLASPIDAGADIMRTLSRLWSRIEPLPRPIRLLGVSVSRISRPASDQLDLFRGEDRRGVDRVMDAINVRFGEGTVRQARLMDDDGAEEDVLPHPKPPRGTTP